jgi:hypothetical protein
VREPVARYEALVPLEVAARQMDAHGKVKDSTHSSSDQAM